MSLVKVKESSNLWIQNGKNIKEKAFVQPFFDSTI